jgi:hypothetical protein
VDAFETCLRNGRLKRVEPNSAQIDEEIRTAISDLRRARDHYADRNNEQCVAQSYFVINRVFRVLLERLGYRDTSVYSMLAGLDHLYVQPGRMEHHLLEILRLAKDQKELVEGGARCGPKETQLILGGAEEAMVVLRKELSLGRISKLDARPRDRGGQVDV